MSIDHYSRDNFKGTYLENIGYSYILKTINKIELRCYGGDKCLCKGLTLSEIYGGKDKKMELHHLDQWAISKNGCWSNIVPLCPNCHTAIHSGFLNGNTFKSLEVLVLEELKYKFKQEIVRIRCNKMDVNVIVPESKFHINFNYYRR